MNLDSKSKFLRLNGRDFLRGLLMAALTPALVLAQQSLDAGELVTDWKALGIASVAGALAYLTKNLFTGTK